MGVCKAKEETPTLQFSPAAQLPEGTNCLACSEDGRYISMGHSQGLSVWCASSLICVAEWLQDTLEITFNQMTRMAQTVYLLGTVDDMGVARIFAYQSEHVHLLSVINPMENVNKRSICLSFELSEGGDYGVASVSCNGDVWLEVYQLPSETWLKQLEVVPLRKQDPSGDIDAEWSQFGAVLKIKPAVTTLHKHKDMKLADFLTHCLSLDVKPNSNCQRRGTHHFLLPCGQSPSNDTTDLQPGLPVAVCVWWSGSYNLLQYSLHTFQKKKTDVEPMPDVVWPNSKEILCSAASRCTRFVAVGLHGAMVCIWDRQSGYPLSVVSISGADSAFSSVKFKDCLPESVEDLQIFIAKVHFLVLCKSGAIFRVTAGRGTQSCTVQSTKRPVDSRDLPTVTASVPFLQSLLLMVQRNGKMFLQDVTNQTIVCYLSLPPSHLITTPCKPVYALSAKQKTLFVLGDPDPSFSATSEEGRQSQLFTFCFDESDITKKYTVSPPDSPQQCNEACVNLEKRCNLYLEHRLLSVDERTKDVTQKWKQLQETAGTLLLQHSQIKKCCK